MFKSRPLFLLVITLCLVLVVVMSYWLALLPQRTLRSLRADMLATSGMTLDAKTARLNLANGFGVMLEDVTVASTSTPDLQLSAKSLSLPGLFGGNMILDQALVDLDVAKLAGAGLAFPKNIMLHDAVLKLRDSKTKSAVAITDINGKIFSDTAEGVQAQLVLVWDNQVSDLNLTIDDTKRFIDDGSPMDVALKSKDMVLAFSGQGRVNDGLKLAGQSTASAKDVGAFLRWLGMPLQALTGAGALSLQSSVASQGLSFSLSKLEGAVAGHDVKGQLSYAAGADRPHLSGELDVDAVSLWGPKQAMSPLSQAWSESPLPVADAFAVDTDLKLKLRQLTLRERDFGAVAAHLKTDGDKLLLDIPEQDLAGGKGRVSISFSRSPKDLGVETELEFKAAEAATLLGGVLGFDRLTGAMDWTAKVTGTGASVAELISTLQGTTALSSAKASLQGVDLPTLLTNPQKGWNTKDEARTDNLTFNIGLALSEGEALFENGKIGLNDISMAPKGIIDILRQAVDVQLSPKGKNIDPKLTMRGPWNAPDFMSPDIATEKSAVAPPAN